MKTKYDIGDKVVLFAEIESIMIDTNGKVRYELSNSVFSAAENEIVGKVISVEDGKIETIKHYYEPIQHTCSTSEINTDKTIIRIATNKEEGEIS